MAEEAGSREKALGESALEPLRVSFAGNPRNLSLCCPLILPDTQAVPTVKKGQKKAEKEAFFPFFTAFFPKPHCM